MGEPLKSFNASSSNILKAVLFLPLSSSSGMGIIIFNDIGKPSKHTYKW
jgi:hypothetical protein